MIAKDVRSQTKFVTSFYTKDKKSFDDMLDENWTGTVNKREIIEKLLNNEYAYVYIKTFYPYKTVVITNTSGW